MRREGDRRGEVLKRSDGGPAKGLIFEKEGTTGRRGVRQPTPSSVQ